MEQPRYLLEPGTVVKTHDPLDPTTGFIIKPEYIEARHPGAVGVIRGIVGGHGGDVYWVQHGENGEGKPVVAAYGFQEFELVKDSKLWWWLSFAEEEEDGGFRGVVLIRGTDMIDAVRNAHRFGINPGGQALGQPLPPEMTIPEWARKKLLTKEECAKLDEEFKVQVLKLQKQDEQIAAQEEPCT